MFNSNKQRTVLFVRNFADVLISELGKLPFLALYFGSGLCLSVRPNSQCCLNELLYYNRPSPVTILIIVSLFIPHHFIVSTWMTRPNKVCNCPRNISNKRFAYALCPAITGEHHSQITFFHGSPTLNISLLVCIVNNRGLSTDPRCVTYFS